MEGSSANPFLEVTSAAHPVLIPFHALPPLERQGTGAANNTSWLHSKITFIPTSHVPHFFSFISLVLPIIQKYHPFGCASERSGAFLHLWVARWHKGCHGEGTRGCLVGLHSDVLPGEGVGWEEVTTDGLQGDAAQAAGTHWESVPDACENRDHSSGACLPFCAHFTQNLHLSLVWLLLCVTPIVTISYPRLQARGTGGDPAEGVLPPPLAFPAGFPGWHLRAQAAGIEWLSAQLPFTF